MLTENERHGIVTAVKSQQGYRQNPVFIISGAVDTGRGKNLGCAGLSGKTRQPRYHIGALKTMVQVTHTVAVQQVLLLEANPIDRKFVENRLKDVAIDIVATETGGDALQLLQTHRFAVVILDYNYPT